jgi:hypothetical protein
MKKAPEGKWLVCYGYHDGTVANRDTGKDTYDTAAAAHKGFRETQSYYLGLRFKIWFADLYDDQGNKTQLAKQNNPR